MQHNIMLNVYLHVHNGVVHHIRVSNSMYFRVKIYIKLLWCVSA